MDKETLENYISRGFSTRMMAQATGKAQTTIVYWLKKYDLETPERKGPYKPMIDPIKPATMRKIIASLDERDKENLEAFNKDFVKDLHARGTRGFGTTSAYELILRLYMMKKAVELGLPADLRKPHVISALAEQAAS